MDFTSTACISFYRPAAVLRVTGEDALSFLQGQFTQELRMPVGARCAYGLWLNQKGKVVADSFALRDGGTWWLVSINCPANSIRERLESYIIADDVILDDLTEMWKGAVITGRQAGHWLRDNGFQLPGPGEWGRIEGGLVFRGRRGVEESWEWLSQEDLGGSAGFLSGLKECDSRCLERSRLNAGIPLVPIDVGPADLPNEAGLEGEAISYTKGCYLGQEVMARLKSLGQVRRQLLRVRGPGTAPLCPAALYAGAKKVGEIRSAVATEDGDGFIGLGMISLLGLGAARFVSLEANGTPVVDILRDPS